MKISNSKRRDIPYNSLYGPTPKPGEVVIPPQVPMPYRQEPSSLSIQVGQVEMLRHRIIELQDAARQALTTQGITQSITWKDVTDTLPELNRSDAQQLLRFLRWYGDPLDIFDKMPGPRRWLKIIKSLNGSVPPQESARLNQATLDFDEQVCNLGGNYSQACKAIREADTRHPTPPSQHANPYSSWVAAAYESIGVLVDTMHCIRVVRQSPQDPSKADHFAVGSLIGVTGKNPKLPLVMSFGSTPYPTDKTGKPSERAAFADGPSASILAQGSTTPFPEYSVVTKNGTSAAVIENGWEQAYPQLDITTLHQLPAFSKLPWLDEKRRLQAVRLSGSRPGSSSSTRLCPKPGRRAASRALRR